MFTWYAYSYACAYPPFWLASFSKYWNCTRLLVVFWKEGYHNNVCLYVCMCVYICILILGPIIYSIALIMYIYTYIYINARFQASASVMRTSLFCDVTLRRLVMCDWLFGKTYQSHLDMGHLNFPETSVTNHRSTLRNITQERRTHFVRTGRLTTLGIGMNIV